MPMGTRLKGIIFDLDGTLANTLPVCFTAFRRAFREHSGRHFSDAEIEALFGPNEEGSIQQVVPDRWEACLETYLKEYASAHSLCPAPFPGMLELLDWLQKQGLKTAIVTGKGAKSAVISLRHLQLAELFDPVETGSAEGSIKPQAIQKVLAAWKLSPEEAAYVGDAPSDIVAAREVGVIPLAAAWSETAKPDQLSEMNPVELFYRVEDLSVWLKANLAPAKP